MSLAVSVLLAGCTAFDDGSAALKTGQRSPQESLESPTVMPHPSLAPSPGLKIVEPASPSVAIASAPTRASSMSAVPSPLTVAEANAVISRIGDRQWARIVATGTWRPECPVGRDDLRRLDVNYIDFDGKIRRGNLIAHRDSVADLAVILTGLFDARFPIGRMESVERYGGDVVRSLKANNTSAFNCRRRDQINAPTMDSPHANGRAIDINPAQNPWTDPRCSCWVPSAVFAENRSGAGVLTKGSRPWQLFTQRGWIWQDIKVPDYMHFDTGFPSRPR